jgi:hypothetical protein
MVDGVGNRKGMSALSGSTERCQGDANLNILIWLHQRRQKRHGLRALHDVRGRPGVMSGYGRRFNSAVGSRSWFRAKTATNLPRPVSSFVVVVNTDHLLCRLAEMEENDDGSLSQEDRDVLRLEENTWGLLQALVP